MLNLSGAQVVPCTPIIGWSHSTPLSSIQSNRFYSPADSQTIPAPGNSSPLQSPILTPIPQIGLNRQLRNQNFTPSSLLTATRLNIRIRSSGGSSVTLPAKRQRLNSSQLSVYDNQLVPRTPASNETPGGHKRTEIKLKPPKLKPPKLRSGSRSPAASQQHSGSSSGSGGRTQKPYFTLDDEDIFLDESAAELPSHVTEIAVTGEDESDIFM